jgi:hypothetical protein
VKSIISLQRRLAHLLLALLIVTVLCIANAWAGAPPAAPPENSHHVSESNSVALAGSTSSSVATGGNANATGAASEASSQNANVYNSTTTVERSVGTLIMGTVIPVDCGFGGQAGGADRNGSGFLGLSWTTKRCYALKAATAWASMGEYELACEMLVFVTREAWHKISRPKPNCHAIGANLRTVHAQSQPAPAAPTSPTVVIVGESLVPEMPKSPAYATEQYVQEAVDRAFRKSVSK